MQGSNLWYVRQPLTCQFLVEQWSTGKGTGWMWQIFSWTHDIIILPINEFNSFMGKVCASINMVKIGLDNGLVPYRHQAIISTNFDVSLMKPVWVELLS